MPDPRPVPQPNGLYAHEIHGPNGRLIEAYTPAPLDPAEIEAMLAEQQQLQPTQAEIADLIMQMDGPQIHTPQAAPGPQPSERDFDAGPHGAPQAAVPHSFALDDLRGMISDLEQTEPELPPTPPLPSREALAGLSLDPSSGVPAEFRAFDEPKVQPNPIVRDRTLQYMSEAALRDGRNPYNPPLLGIRSEPMAEPEPANPLPPGNVLPTPAKYPWWQLPPDDDIPAEFRDMLGI